MPRKSEKTFTSRLVPGLPPGSYVARDLPGFLFNVKASGDRFFACRYTVKSTRRRRYVSLGRWGTVTFAQASAKAKELLASAALGEDPRPRERVTTWGEWSQKYFERGAWKAPEGPERYLGLSLETRKSKRGAAANPVFREIRAKWANRTLDSFMPEDIEEARQDVREYGRILANRWLACIAGCFNAAFKSEILARNPARNVKADRENAGRQRVLSPAEMKALLLAIDAEKDPHAKAALLLLVMTGARSGEILAAEWSHVDLDERRIRLPDSKSGRPRILPLPPRAVELLRALPRVGKYVITGARADHQKPDLKSVWRRISKRAGLVGVHPHDVRRSFGAELARVAGLRLASLALGHESISITEKSYSPESFKAILEAADKRAALLPWAEAAKEGQP
jgi:integrase